MMAKQTDDVAGEAWKQEVLWDSDVAREHLHPKLGPVWTAVLEEALQLPPRRPIDDAVRTTSSVRTMPIALAVQSVPMLKWYVAHDGPLNKKTSLWIAKGGHLDVLAYAKSKGCRFHSRIWKVAAHEGHLDVLKYGFKAFACKSTYPDPRCRRDKELCLEAAKGGRLHVLQYLRDSVGCPWDADEMCHVAAEGGSVEILQYAHENGCRLDERTCWKAAAGGHFGVLKYAHEHGCPWDEETCMEAARGGHLHVLRYLHANGCPWDYATCKYAARGGHLDVLKYAVKRGCMFDATLCWCGARQTKEEIIARAASEDRPVPEEEVRRLDDVIAWCHPYRAITDEMLDWDLVYTSYRRSGFAHPFIRGGDYDLSLDQELRDAIVL